MNLKFFLNRKGSTLLLVLVYMAILSMLGTTLLSLTLSNYKVQKMDGTLKNAFYSAEGGLAEAHAVIEQEVINAIDYGNTEVEAYLADPNNRSDYIEIDDITGEEKVDEEKLRAKMEEVFDISYEEHIKNNVINSIDNIEDDSTSLSRQNYGSSIEIDSTVLDEYVTNNDEYILKVESQYETDGGINRRISKKFTILTPKYGQEFEKPYYEEKKYYNLDVFSASGFTGNVLTAEREIKVFNNNDITIETGSVYAGGRAGLSINSSDFKVKDGNVSVTGGDGISINNSDFEIQSGSIYASGGNGINVDSSSFDILEGDVMSKNDLKVSGSSSDVKILGDVYCKTLELTSDAKNSTIEVGEATGGASNKYRVFTKDDLEHNGSNSDLIINGGYYGFSDGRDAVTHDKSSSIVVNSKDIGSDSQLYITGEKSSRDGEKYGIVLGGTSYLDFEGNKYQTGESVALSGNYIAYTPPIVSQVIDNVKNSLGSNINIVDPDNYNNYSYGGVTVELADEYMDNGVTEDLTALIKGELLTQSFNTSAFSVSVGWNGSRGIKLDNILYSTGAYLSQGIFNNDQKGYLDIEGLINSIKSNFNNKTNESNYASDISDISSNIHVFEPERNEICYVNDTGDGDVVLLGQNGSLSNIVESDGTYDHYDVGDEVEGIIITNGNVYIMGELDFRGIIASEKNIYFIDSHDKKLTLDAEVEIQNSKEVIVGTETGLDNYIDTSSLIKAEEWEWDYGDDGS